MAIRIVRLGTPRKSGEGPRIGTVRRPPRGVPKERFAADDWYDVWYPNLSPSPPVMQIALHAKDDKDWAEFTRKFKAEMAQPDASRSLDLLATLSHSSNFSMGCYCENEARCHRSLLRALLQQRGAQIAD